LLIINDIKDLRRDANRARSCHLMPSDAIWSPLRRHCANWPIPAEPNLSATSSLGLLVDSGTASTAQIGQYLRKTPLPEGATRWAGSGRPGAAHCGQSSHTLLRRTHCWLTATRSSSQLMGDLRQVGDELAENRGVRHPFTNCVSIPLRCWSRSPAPLAR
jgi:hypothetical protein